MASIQKTAKGYRAQINIKGQRDSRQFATRRKSNAWAAQREFEFRNPKPEPSPAESHTLADAVSRYIKEVSPSKRGYRWELIRAEALLKNSQFPSSLHIGGLTTTHFANWRDARSRHVQAGTVLREISFIGAVIDCARIEWQWISSNPLKDIKKPRMPDHREVIIPPVGCGRC